MPLARTSALFPHSPATFQAAGHRPDSLRTDSSVASETIVYVVSDDAKQSTRLTQLFLLHGISVKAFRTASEYIRHATPDRLSCVVLDLNLPDVSGLEVQNRLAENGGPPVVFVTSHADLNTGVHAMKNGAIDFMIEPFDDRRLLASVEIAFTQERKRRKQRVERLSLLKRWKSLTPREQEVFGYTVAGFLNKQSAAELGITENTFQVHRGRVMRKMKADSLAELVRMSTRLEWPAASVATNEATAMSPQYLAPASPEGHADGLRPSLGIHQAYPSALPVQRNQFSGPRRNDRTGFAQTQYPFVQA